MTGRTEPGECWQADDDRSGGTEPPSMLLLTQPPTTEGGRDACIDALTAHPPTRANLLVVTHEQSPDEWLTTWRQRIGEVPADLALIAADSPTRSTARSSPAPQQGAAGDQPVVALSDPGDLTQLGIVVSERLTEWRDTDCRPVVCGGSITALLQWVDLPVLFRFLHVFIQRLRAAGALAHFHLHPDAHPAQTRRTLAPLFDRVVDEPLNRLGARRDDLADGEIRDLLGESRRRHILWILLDEGSISVDELATRVLARERPATAAPASDLAQERTRIDLHHNHLAKLATAGLIDYDETAHPTIRLAAPESLVKSYLDSVDEQP